MKAKILRTRKVPVYPRDAIKRPTGNPAASMWAAGVRPGDLIVVTDLAGSEGREVELLVTAIGIRKVLVRRPSKRGRAGEEFAYGLSGWGVVE